LGALNENIERMAGAMQLLFQRMHEPPVPVNPANPVHANRVTVNPVVPDTVNAPGVPVNPIGVQPVGSGTFSHASSSHQRKPRVPRDFDGKSENWEDYFQHFQSTANWNGWDLWDKAAGLYLALVGPAANYVNSSPNRETLSFEELCALLDTRFGAGCSTAMEKRMLRERRREKNETYADLGQDMLRLARRIYPDDLDRAEKEARNHLIRSLPTHLRIPLATREFRGVWDIIEAISKMSDTLDADEDMNEIKKVRRAGFQPDGPKWQQKKSPDNSGQKRADTKSTCWDCGEPGHRRNKCPHHFKFKPKQQANPTVPKAVPPPVSQGEEDTPKDGGLQ
jgi:hypothetical protein